MATTSVASLKFVEQIIDLEEGSRFVILARLSCLVVGQPFDRLRAGSFQAVVLTGWKPVPLKGDKHRVHYVHPFMLHILNSGH